jgi:hypothetical protein
MARIRKAVYELTSSDFEAHPYWQYAYDEEGAAAQDECTVRPVKLPDALGEAGPMFTLAAFFFPNGRMRHGVVTVNAGDDVVAHQPVLFLQTGHVLFYHGALRPSAKERSEALRNLRKISPQPFPINYVSAARNVDMKPRALGILLGLYWLSNLARFEVSFVA